MAKAKRTPEEAARARAEGAAKRYNNEQAAKAPLLAHAGLTPTRTADDVLERRTAYAELHFWSGLEHDQYIASKHTVMAWHRYIVHSLVDADTYERVREWADRQTMQTFFIDGKTVHMLADDALVYWSYKWRQAAERAQRGEDPLPTSAYLTPSACWPDLLRALNDGSWKESLLEHGQAGCTREHCIISNRPSPGPFRQTATAFVREDGMTLREWETSA